MLGLIVWAHHFMTAGLPVPALLYFMYSTMAISLPLAVLFFCWIATMWRGAMSFETPMLFAVGFIVLFGTAVGNGVILVTFFNQLRQKGLAPAEAVRKGCELRLRPLMMTTRIRTSIAECAEHGQAGLAYTKKPD